VGGIVWVVLVRWRGDVGKEGCADGGDEDGESDEVFVVCGSRQEME
jgi:hypothetical protein